jgi:Methyltransferase domain
MAPSRFSRGSIDSASGIPLLQEPCCLEVFSLIAEARDIIDERVAGLTPPAWAVARGWDRFLLGISESDLERLERRALHCSLAEASGAPETLRDLSRRAASAVRLPLAPGEEPGGVGRLLHASPRKGVQVEQMVAALGGVRAKVERIVDLGAGIGHLTRRATEARNVPALGLDREERLIERACALSPRGGGGARFSRFDALAGSLNARPTDLLLGLHACGALSDLLVEAAARAGCPIVLVSCCYQKRTGPWREPLSDLGRRWHLAIDIGVLGLANLRPRPEPLGGRLQDFLEERTARHALQNLLKGRGLEADADRTLRRPRGQRVYRGFAGLARASCRERGLDPPDEREIEAALTRARSEMAAIRRLSLPRNMLARPLELAIAADRAAYLRERGFTPRLAEAFPDDISPRNVLLVAEP